MKLDKEEKENLLQSLLPLLDDEATREPKKPTFYTPTKGARLIAVYGLTKDAKGRAINPNVMYNWPTFIPVKIDHKAVLGQIIADANSAEEMETRLAEHLAKYPKDKAAVIRKLQAGRN